jgi:hypothetical protein
MRHALRPLLLVLLSAALATGTWACGSDPVTPRPLHPLAGVYDVTASIDTMSPRLPCSTPPGGYCYVSAPTNGFAAFTGVLTIADTASSSSFPRPLQLGAQAMIQPCATSDQVSGCTAAAAGAPATFVGGFVVADSTSVSPIELVLLTPEGQGATQLMMLDLRSAVAGDSLGGRIEWDVNGGAKYWGTFTAHKRP